jgi:hypothetical protein
VVTLFALVHRPVSAGLPSFRMAVAEDSTGRAHALEGAGPAGESCRGVRGLAHDFEELRRPYGSVPIDRQAENVDVWIDAKFRFCTVADLAQRERDLEEGNVVEHRHP